MVGHEVGAALNGRGIAAEQHAQPIFSDHDLPLEIRNRCGSGGQRGFGRRGFEFRNDAALKARAAANQRERIERLSGERCRGKEIGG